MLMLGMSLVSLFGLLLSNQLSGDEARAVDAVSFAAHLAEETWSWLRNKMRQALLAIISSNVIA